MKVEFSLITTYIPEWEGNRDLAKHEQVSVECRAMGTTDLLALGDALERAQIGAEVTETKKIKTEQASILLDQAAELIPKYCKILNLEDLDGPVTADRVVTVPRYNDLGLEILMNLAGIVTPDEDDLKNLSAPLDGSQSPTGGDLFNDSPE
jgi:hypothetical protein